MCFVAFDRERRYDAHLLSGKALIVVRTHERPFETSRLNFERVSVFERFEAIVDARCDAFARCEIDAAILIDGHAKIRLSTPRMRTVLHDFHAGKSLIVDNRIEGALKNIC